jgi:hypothetical protein
MRNRAARSSRAPALRSQAFPDQQCGIAARKSAMVNVGVALQRGRDGSMRRRGNKLRLAGCRCGRQLQISKSKLLVMVVIRAPPCQGPMIGEAV